MAIATETAPDAPPAEAEGAAEEEFDRRPVLLRRESDENGVPRPDLWREGLSDFSELDVAPVGEWVQIGPAPLLLGNPVARHAHGTGPMAGEVTDIAIDPTGTADDRIYIATNDGGIWRSADGGLTWAPATDGMRSLSMGAVALDPVDPAIVYAGTGNQFDGGHTFTRGVGLYRSTDRGITWSIVDGGPFGTLFADKMITHIVLPAAGVLLVGTLDGLYRSVDGGFNFGANAACTDGQPVLKGFITALKLSTQTPATTIYAAVSGQGMFPGRGIFVSTDAGATFPPASNLFSRPGAPVVYGDIALAQSTQPNGGVMFASVQISPPYPAKPQFVGLYRYTTASGAWTREADADRVVAVDGAGQTNYDLTIGIDPRDANRVYIGFQELWLSTGSAARNFGAAPCTANQVHFDHHALVFSPAAHWGPAPPAPTPPATPLCVGTDGGFSRGEPVPGSTNVNWSNRNGGVATNLFYGIDMGRGSAANREFTYGGTQDNSLDVRGPGDGADGWHLGHSGDGGHIAVDPADPHFAYGFVNQFYARSKDAGQTFQLANVAPPPVGIGLSNPADDWTRRVVVEQTNPTQATRVVYVSEVDQLYKSADGGVNFTAQRRFDGRIYSLAAAATDANRLWVGLENGAVHRSRDAGATWDAGPFITRPGGPGAVSSITLDPANINRVAIVYAGYAQLSAVSRTRHVFLSEDDGATWRDISGTDDSGPVGNLPDLPLHDVVFDPSTVPPTIVVAGDAGVARSTNLGTSWQALGVGLPSVDCTALALDRSAAPPVLRVGTYGRSCFELTRPATQKLIADSNLAFGGVRVGRSATLIIDLYNPGTAPLTITNVQRVTPDPAYTLDPAPALPATIPATGHLALSVKFQPTADGESNASFRIDSDDPSAASYFVLASGRGVAAAGVPRVAARRNLGFGTLFKGNHRTLKLQVANAGLGDLHVTAITRVSGSSDMTMVTAVALPLVLPPGDAQELEFRFEPTDNDDRSATFQIVSDDPRSAFAVQLSGSGTGFSSPWLAIGLIVLGAAVLGGGYLAYRELVQKH